MIWEVRSEQDQGRLSTGLVWAKRREGAVWFSVCGAPLDDWVNGGYVDVLFKCGECGFRSLGSWSYSKEWVKLGTKSMWHCYREIKCQQGDTPGIYYQVEIVVAEPHFLRVCDLMVSATEFPGRAVYAPAWKYKYCEVFVKYQYWKK